VALLNSRRYFDADIPLAEQSGVNGLGK